VLAKLVCHLFRLLALILFKYLLVLVHQELEIYLHLPDKKHLQLFLLIKLMLLVEREVDRMDPMIKETIH